MWWSVEGRAGYDRAVGSPAMKLRYATEYILADHAFARPNLFVALGDL